MARTVSAVYENGVLRPLEPVSLAENQRVTVTIAEPFPGGMDEWLDQEYLAGLAVSDEPEPTLEEVWRATSQIPGKLSDAVREEREARG